MPKPPVTTELTLEGPAGGLEALLESPADTEPQGSALILHPHPEQGGTMQNKVVHTLARAFQHRGMRSLRFNFRGTGASDGEFDDAEGEYDDAVAAMHYLAQRWPDSPLWIAGFSFGAAIAIRVAAGQVVSGLVSVAPAVSRFVGKLEKQPTCPWLIVHGDKDEVVPVDDSVAWVNGLDPGPELQVFSGAGHFFHGRLVELREAVDRFVAEHAD